MMMPNHPKSDFKASPRLSRFTNSILALVFNPSTPSLLCPHVTGGNSWWWNQSLVLMLIKTTTGISTFHKPMSKPIVQADKAFPAIILWKPNPKSKHNFNIRAMDKNMVCGCVEKGHPSHTETDPIFCWDPITHIGTYHLSCGGGLSSFQTHQYLILLVVYPVDSQYITSNVDLRFIKLPWIVLIFFPN